MNRFTRKVFPYLLLGFTAVALYFALSRDALPPADFTFSNGTEIKTVDPAVVTGQPEGRIIRALYEGLIDWDPKTLDPIPGAADEWEISDDRKTYTFSIRREAVWSNGEPLTAYDFEYSLRRFLDPMIASEYAHLLADVVNAEKYSKGEVESGDPVEVELLAPPADALPHARNEVVRGRLVEIEEVPLGAASDEENEDEEPVPARIYVVEVDGERRRYSAQLEDLAAAPQVDVDSVLPCTQVILDFGEVGIRALGERRIQIQLKHPVPYFLKLMGFYPLFPVNRECLETYGYPDWTKTENIVTNGPFLLEYRRVRDRIRLVKNPRYWDRENVHIEIMDALACDSITTDLNMYMTGQVDWISQVPPTIIPELLRQDREDFQPVPYLGIYYYGINMQEPALQDIRVRRALSLAIDRGELVAKVTRAGQIPAYRFVPPGLGLYDQVKQEAGVSDAGSAGGSTLDERIAQAQQLMSEAGFPDGKGFPKIEILYNTNDMHGQIAELIQAHWRENLGVQSELVNKEWGTYLADQRQRKYFVARNGWIGDYADPNTFLDLFVTDGPQNRTGFSNPEYDRLIASSAGVELTEQERAEVEQAVRNQPDWSEAEHEEQLLDAVAEAERRKRMRIFLEAEDLLLDELPVIPLYYYVTQSMVRPYVRGFYQNIQDTHPYKGIWIDREMKQRILEAEGLQ